MSYISSQKPEKLAQMVKDLLPNYKEYGIYDIAGTFQNPWRQASNERLQILFLGPPTKYNPKGHSIGYINLVEQPACCGLGVSIYTELDEPLQGKGLARKLLWIKEQLMMHCGYSAMQVTVCWNTGEKASAEIHVLKSTPGWVLDYSFVNKRTLNTISVFHKILWDRQNIVQAGTEPNSLGDIPTKLTVAENECRCFMCLPKGENKFVGEVEGAPDLIEGVV